MNAAALRHPLGRSTAPRAPHAPPLLLFATALTLAACGETPTNLVSNIDAGSDATDVSEDTGDTAVGPGSPTTPRVVAAAATSLGSARVFWQPSSDDVTDPDDLRYEVHAATSADFDPRAVNRVATAVGGTSAEVTGLPEGGRLYFTVVAHDTDGNASAPGAPIGVELLREEPRLRSGIVLHDWSQVPPGQHDGVIYRFDADSVPEVPLSGDFVVGEAQDGPFLTRVVTATVAQAIVVLDTEAASPSDVLASAEVSAALRLGPPPAEAFTHELDGGVTEATWSTHQPGGWLRFVERRTSDRGAAFGLRVDLDAELGGGAQLSGRFEMAPELDVRLRLDDAVAAQRAAVSLSSASTFSGLVELDLAAGASVEYEAELHDLDVAVAYWLGPVPIRIETGVGVAARAVGAASSALDATLEFSVETDTELGLRYEQTAWTGLDESDGTPRVTPSLAAPATGGVGFGLSTEVAVDVVGELETSTAWDTRFDNTLTASNCAGGAAMAVADSRFVTSATAEVVYGGETFEVPVTDVQIPAFQLPPLAITGPSEVFRPDGARFRATGLTGVGAEVDAESLRWTVTPEATLRTDAGTATVIPDVASAEAQTYELRLDATTDALGDDIRICAPPLELAAINRQATCNETRAFIVPGERVTVSTVCTDPDRDYPLEVAIVDGPFTGTVEGLPTVGCVEGSCTVRFVYTVPADTTAFSDALELMPTDSLGQEGSTAGSFGNVFVAFNRPPSGEALTVIMDLSADGPTRRRIQIPVVDPAVTGDPQAGEFTTEVTLDPSLGSISTKLGEDLYEYEAPAYNVTELGSPLPSVNLFDELQITPTDAHGAVGRPIDVTVILRPPLCDGVELDPPEGLEDRLDYCVIEYCSGGSCNVECLPRAALENPLAANRARYPAGTTCAEKAEFFGTAWGDGAEADPGSVVDAPCPCAPGRDYADDVWLEYDAPSPYDTCEAFPFTWYAVCTAPEGWSE
jgi:hypothetical protein